MSRSPIIALESTIVEGARAGRVALVALVGTPEARLLGIVVRRTRDHFIAYRSPAQAADIVRRAAGDAPARRLDLPVAPGRFAVVYLDRGLASIGTLGFSSVERVRHAQAAVRS